MFSSLELFSGAGGMALGLESTGFEHRAFIEFNKDACQSLRLNYSPDIVCEIDIRYVDFNKISSVDIIAGGPPCQPFSLGGKHLGNSDNRDMFPYAIRAIENLKPKAFIFENVKGLTRTSFKEYFEYIIRRLKQPSHSSNKYRLWTKHLDDLRKSQNNSNGYCDYDVNYKVLNAADFGVPQNRERVVIVGLRRDLGMDWKFPKPTHSRDRLMWEKYVTHEYWDRNEVKNSSWDVSRAKARCLRNQLENKYGLFPPAGKAWLTVRDAISDLPDPKSNHGISEHQYRKGAKSYPGHSGSDYDKPSKTIKAGGHGVPGGENMIRYRNGAIRYYTVLEAKRIQTFPDEYIISGSWGEAMRQIGNAVPVTLAQVLGMELFCIMEKPSDLSNTDAMQHEVRLA